MSDHDGKGIGYKPGGNDDKAPLILVSHYYKGRVFNVIWSFRATIDQFH